MSLNKAKHFQMKNLLSNTFFFLFLFLFFFPRFLSWITCPSRICKSALKASQQRMGKEENNKIDISASLCFS